MNRRKFIKYTSLFSVGTAYLANAESIDSLKAETAPISNIDGLVIKNDEIAINREQNFTIPPLLAPGARIAFASPSSVTNLWEVSKAVTAFKNAGLEVEIGRIIKNQKNKFRYLAAPDEDRAKEFMEFVERPDIDAIISGRGGYGSMRIADLLDFEKISRNPKIYIGFSDFTFLLNTISQKAKIITYHGPIGVSSFSEFSRNYLFKVILENQPRSFSYTCPNAIQLVKGNCVGRIVGGNLTMLAASLGTKHEINTDEAILFFEDTNEQPYQVDRMITQLKLAGKFDNIKGIIVGQFSKSSRRKAFYPNYSYTMVEVFEQLLSPIGVPTLLNVPIGHISEQITMPINSIIELNTTKKEINFLYKTSI